MKIDYLSSAGFDLTENYYGDYFLFWPLLDLFVNYCLAFI